MLRILLLSLMLAGCYEKGNYLNYSPDELSSESAKRGLGHFESVTTTDIVFTKQARLIQAFSIWRMGFPAWPNGKGYTIAEAVNPQGRITFNCALCHSGWVGKTFVGGLPNRYYSPWLFSNSFSAIRLAQYIQSDKGLKASGKYTETILGPLMEKNSHTVGGTVGTWAVYATSSHIPKDSKTMDEWDENPNDFKKFIKSTDGVLPIHHPRPWWLAKYNGKHFWMEYSPATQELSAADLALALETPNYGNPDAYEWHDRFRISADQQQYMYEISSPKYPKPLNQDMVNTGYELYHLKSLHCADCHGSFVKLKSNKYQYVRSKLDSQKIYKYVKTDIQYWQVQYDNARMFTDHVHTNKEFRDSKGFIDVPRPIEKPNPYYNAAPLIGIWASSPYLHNGSVPTLWDMLQPAANRPKKWRLDRDLHAYDYEKVGAKYYTTGVDKDDPYVYDTLRDKRHGMTNVGHEFGTKLSKQDKLALIEFLKSLGTDNVRVPKD